MEFARFLPALAGLGLTISTGTYASASDQKPEAEPVNDPGTWVLPTDYPGEELIGGVEGVTAFKLNVDAEGKPTVCTIEESSGSEHLDARTCKLVMQRARFKPARDVQGKAVASSYVNKVRWVAQQIDWPKMVVDVTLNENGYAESCEVVEKDQEMLGTIENPCPGIMGQGMTQPIGGTPQRYKVRLTVTLQWYPIE